MSFNLEYLYSNLPARYRRDDVDQNFILRRFLTWFAEQMDAWDEKVENFHEEITAETASEWFILWWLWELFYWGWFPHWFTLAQKRQFYANVALHYARRGTARGIKEFLAAFGIPVIVNNRPLAWGGFAWGDNRWSITGPLGLVIQVPPIPMPTEQNLNYWGRFAWGKGHWATPVPDWTEIAIESLVRFQQPNAQTVIIEYILHPYTAPVDSLAGHLDFTVAENSHHLLTIGL